MCLKGALANTDITDNRPFNRAENFTMPKKLDYWVLFFYCGVIYWLSNQSKLPAQDLFEFEDKVNHFLAYGVMGICAWRVFRHFGTSLAKVFIFSWLFSSLYGVSDEWHQSFVIGRTSSAFDWMADTIGSLLTISAYYWYSSRPQNQLNSKPSR
jgi:VanZ family protein